MSVTDEDDATTQPVYIELDFARVTERTSDRIMLLDRGHEQQEATAAGTQ